LKVKAAVMLYVVLRMDEVPLMTLGDAVESFLDVEDKTTRGRCLAARTTFTKAESNLRASQGEQVETQWANPQVRWRDAPTPSRYRNILVPYADPNFFASKTDAIQVCNSVGDFGWDVTFCDQETSSNIITFKSSFWSVMPL
jgi:hypothetical protein